MARNIVSKKYFFLIFVWALALPAFCIKYILGDVGKIKNLSTSCRKDKNLNPMECKHGHFKMIILKQEQMFLNYTFKLKWWNYRSSRPEILCQKDVLRNFAKFTGKQLCQILFFNKIAGLSSTGLFPWILRNF